MSAEVEADLSVASVDQAMAAWRQGDCVVGEHWFVSRFDAALPLSSAAKSAASDEDVDLADELVPGFVVVTQTCDIVRTCTDRPFVEVSPLVELDDEAMRQVERGGRPRYAVIAALQTQRLVADLDRTMTLEKPVARSWLRTPGWTTDTESRAFAQALTRKRGRFAFPDDFSEWASKLQARLKKQHDKQSHEGRALQGLREIRVQATPSWDAPSVELTFWFIREEASAEAVDWPTVMSSWLELVPPQGRFAKVWPAAGTLEDMTAADYVSSDAFDLDHLSSQTVAGAVTP